MYKDFCYKYQPVHIPELQNLTIRQLLKDSIFMYLHSSKSDSRRVHKGNYWSCIDSIQTGLFPLFHLPVPASGLNKSLKFSEIWTKLKISDFKSDGSIRLEHVPF